MYKLTRNGLLAVFTVMMILPLSCSKSGLFDAGPETTREIDLPLTISQIEVAQMFSITLVNDTTNRVLVTCGKNLQPDIDISVKNNILYLNHHVKNTWSRKYDKIKLELHLTRFPRFNIRKPVYMTTADTLKTDYFGIVDFGKFTELDVTLLVKQCSVGMSSDNFGHYTLKGKADYAELWGWGSTFLYATDLSVGNCVIKHRGIGDIYVNVSHSLTVSLEAAGNIYYKGKPSITIQQQSSSGRLIPLK